MIRNTLLILVLGTSIAPAAESVVWQIGQSDRNYREFALAGNHAAFAKQFAKPVLYEIGRSEPARDWPFIHPGPADAWAGNAVHSRTVRFPLTEQPSGVFTLRIEFADVHALFTPSYSVSIAGRSGSFRLPPGGGDASLIDPQKGKPHKIEIPLPATMFHPGVNEISLACTDGSWVQYDALTLANDREAKMPEPDIQSIAVAPTPFYIRDHGKTRRAAEVTVNLTAPAGDLDIKAEAAGETIDIPVKQLPILGAINQEIALPDVPGPLEVKVTATIANRSKTTMVNIAPQRKWRIFVAPSTHTDVGYTDTQPQCAERHDQNTDAAVQLCQKHPSFRWNLEVAWQAENYLRSRDASRREDFLRLAREGRIGVQALYCNILTGLCSPEEACRLTAFAHQLARRTGVRYGSAMISDVPTQEASLPMILANAGIRYFSSGINNVRAFPFVHMVHKCPAWWEGPDGSRVLMMWMPGYAQASGMALDQSIERAHQQVLTILQGYQQRPDYPCDAIFLHGAFGDNQPLSPKLAEMVQAWNERYEFPKVILSRNDEFFEYVEKNFGDKLPVYRGSGGTYWEDGAGSSARETALCRNAHESIGNAEKLLALAGRLGSSASYPSSAIDDAWRNCLLYDEHTWGAHCSIDQPESEFTKAQWKIKAQFAIDADQQSKTLLEQGLQSLAALVQTEHRSLVVVNPSSWKRTDVLRVKLPQGTAIDEPDVLSCQTAEGTFVLAKDVPPCGYRLFKLGNAEKQQDAEPTSDMTLESRLYRVQFDPAGAITSILDKELGKELVDPKAPYRLNQYLYVTGGKGPKGPEWSPSGPLAVSSPSTASFKKLKLGKLGEMMILESSTTMTPKVTTAVVVWNDIKRIDISNRLTKTPTYEKEAAYFAFPFAVQKPAFRYEIPAGIVDVSKDMLPGACLDWFTVQHFVEIEGTDATVAWATPDAPLACFQDINRGKWQTDLPMINGHVYAYVMNNYWFTNYLAGQGGDMTFRFSITSRAKADRVASAKFGWSVSNPLLAATREPAASAPLAAASASLITIDEPNVILIGARRATSGNGLLLRLWEVAGQSTTAHLHLGALAPRKVTACNLVEDEQVPLEMRDSAVAVPLRGSGLATLIVQ